MINLLDYVTGQILLGRIKGPPEDAAKFLRLDGSAISLGGAGELIFLRVTGNGGPDSPNGDYAYYGEHNGYPAYQTVIDGTTYYLTKGVLIGPDDDKYRITENVPVGQGGMGHAWTGPADGTIEGDYTAATISGATGAPNVEVLSVAAAASASATAAAASAAALLPQRMTAAFVSGPKTVTETPAALFAGSSVLSDRAWLLLRNESTDTRLRAGRLQANLQRDGLIVEPQSSLLLVLESTEALTIYGASEGAPITVSIAEDAAS
jgi:hypothetical protein